MLTVTVLDPSVAGPDPGSGSGKNNPDHISESLKTIFLVKILKFFYVDPESGMEKNSASVPVCVFGRYNCENSSIF
jgi:hypothetical protein